MKTAQDSYTITMKKIVRFQERMHLEKFQVDKIQNGRLSVIIHLDRPHTGLDKFGQEVVAHWATSRAELVARK